MDGKDGSPILIYGRSVQDKLQLALWENDFKVHLAMRYQNPSMDDILAKMEKSNYKKIIIIPCFHNMLLQAQALQLKKQ